MAVPARRGPRSAAGRRARPRLRRRPRQPPGRLRRALCKTGLAALVFDYRGFGASEGQPRDLVDPGRQRQDYEAALDWIGSRPDLDAQRVALWGTSYSGGHVLQLAAERDDLRAVVAMVPHADGLATLGVLPPLQGARVLAAGLQDLAAGRLGLPPRHIKAVGAPGELAAMTADGALDDWRHVVDIDLLGVAWGCHITVLRMRKRGRGRILNISSLAAFGAPAGQAPYNAAKAGVLALTESLAAELHDTNVQVSAACPTFFVTSITENMRVVDGDERLRQRLVLEDAAQGTPESVAEAILDCLFAGDLHIFPQRQALWISRLKRLLGPRMVGISVRVTKRRGEQLMAEVKAQHEQTRQATAA